MRKVFLADRVREMVLIVGVERGIGLFQRITGDSQSMKLLELSSKEQKLETNFM